VSFRRIERPSSRILSNFLTDPEMRRPLPLNALRVFEVAARTGSYAEAGSVLGLTHGAVSRQIALLETWLGQRLFVRTGRRMTATPAARVFAAEVSLSFDRMTAAAEACGRPSARHLLRVSAPMLPHRPEQRRRVFDHFFVTLQAVLEGLGIGVGPLPVLQTDVVAGRLLTPFPAIQVPRTGYVALVPFDANKTSALTSFIDWLIAEGSA
jgi:DNA-binding transcriptional LysR family regulator